MLPLGLLLVLRYAWVMDDAYVYARYADNAALLGVGLVYNAGEFVEGFTSPLWMLWVLAGRLMHVPLAVWWFGSGALLYALTWHTMVRVDAALAAGRPRVGLALGFLGANYAVASWFTSGMETGVVQAVAVGYALFLVRPEARLGQVLVGLSVVVRPELVPAFVLAVGYVAWTRGAPRVALAIGGALGASWLVFRVYYYADLLPVTFYLKDATEPGQGLRYLVNAWGSYHLEVVMAVAVTSLVVARRRGLVVMGRERAAMVVVGLPVVVYAVRVGGDAMHFRYLAFPFCLLACATAGAVEAWLATRARARWVRPAIACGVVAGSVWMQPPQREVHALIGPGDPQQIAGISDPGWHRRREDLRATAWLDMPSEVARAYGSREFVYVGTIAEGWCVRAYRLLDRRVVHELGLTDGFLARVAIDEGRAGHKYGLRRLSYGLAYVVRVTPVPGVGMLRAAVEKGIAAPWIAENLAALEVIERKVFNKHSFAENVGLALTFPGPIVP